MNPPPPGRARVTRSGCWTCRRAGGLPGGGEGAPSRSREEGFPARERGAGEQARALVRVLMGGGRPRRPDHGTQMDITVRLPSPSSHRGPQGNLRPLSLQAPPPDLVRMCGTCQSARGAVSGLGVGTSGRCRWGPEGGAVKTRFLGPFRCKLSACSATSRDVSWPHSLCDAPSPPAVQPQLPHPRT